MKVTVADFGVGNLHSIMKAVERSGASVQLETDPLRLPWAECLILPGVASFGAVAKGIEGVRDELLSSLEDGLPCLGVCVGMQVLFEESEESRGRGLGFLKGSVRKLRAGRVPHMGWNFVKLCLENHPLFDGLEEDEPFYFAHSYVAEPEGDVVLAWTNHEVPFVAAVKKRNTYGVQFHPEKSYSAGLKLIKNFLDLAEEAT